LDHPRSAPRTSPAVLRQEVADRLRDLRLAAGLTIEEVAARLLVSTSKISRIETATRPASLRDVRDLAELYGIGPAQVDELMALTQDSRQQSDWQQYGSGVSDHAELEEVAVSIAHYETSLIPGLLQTPDYARAVTAGKLPDVPEADREKMVRGRLARQERLLGAGTPQLVYVIDEAAILRQVGGAAVLRDQLVVLAERSRLPAVDLRVIPMDAGAHPGMNSSFEILSFATVSAVVYSEGLAGDFYLRRDADLDRYGAVFRRLREMALDSDSSVHLILARASDLSDR
jgi:transcriptional regulator with XRE-family HTH domain